MISPEAFAEYKEERAEEINQLAQSQLEKPTLEQISREQFDNCASKDAGKETGSTFPVVTQFGDSIMVGIDPDAFPQFRKDYRAQNLSSAAKDMAALLQKNTGIEVVSQLKSTGVQYNLTEKLCVIGSDFLEFKAANPECQKAWDGVVSGGYSD